MCRWDPRERGSQEHLGLAGVAGGKEDRPESKQQAQGRVMGGMLEGGRQVGWCAGGQWGQGWRLGRAMSHGSPKAMQGTPLPGRRGHREGLERSSPSNKDTGLVGPRPWGSGRSGDHGVGLAGARASSVLWRPGVNSPTVCRCCSTVGAEPGKGWWSPHTQGNMRAACGQGCMGRCPWRGESG